MRALCRGAWEAGQGVRGKGGSRGNKPCVQSLMSERRGAGAAPRLQEGPLPVLGPRTAPLLCTASFGLALGAPAHPFLGLSGSSPVHMPLSLPLPTLCGLTDSCLPLGVSTQDSLSQPSGWGTQRCGQDPVQDTDAWGGGQGWGLTLPSRQSGRASWQRGPSN